MPGLSPHKRILSANQRQVIIARGTTIFLRAATGEVAVSLRSTAVGTATGATYTLRMTAAEKWFHAEEFDEVIIEDMSGAANTLEFYIGYGDFEKPVPDIVNVAVDVPASRVIVSTTDKTNIDIGNAGIQLIHAEDLTRIRIIVTALSTNTDIIRIGDINVDTNIGIPLAAGESVALDTTAAIYACSEAANDQGAAHSDLTL